MMGQELSYLRQRMRQGRRVSIKAGGGWPATSPCSRNAANDFFAFLRSFSMITARSLELVALVTFESRPVSWPCCLRNSLKRWRREQSTQMFTHWRCFAFNAPVRETCSAIFACSVGLLYLKLVAPLLWRSRNLSRSSTSLLNL